MPVDDPRTTHAPPSSARPSEQGAANNEQKAANDVVPKDSASRSCRPAPPPVAPVSRSCSKNNARWKVHDRSSARCCSSNPHNASSAAARAGSRAASHAAQRCARAARRRLHTRRQ